MVGDNRIIKKKISKIKKNFLYKLINLEYFIKIIIKEIIRNIQIIN